ncbi:head GIN domain-containing protein [Hymenobacter coalescens]
MKTNSLLTLLALTSPLLLGSCGKDGLNPTVRGEGPSVSETRAVANFSRVEVATDAELVITQGAQQEVRVEGQRNILDVLDTDVSGGKLRIETGRYNLRSHEPIRVVVTVPTLTGARLSSNGSIRSTVAWNASDFEVEDTGSGNVDLALGQVQDLRTSITGSGSVTLHGSADQHDARLTGSGELQAYDLSSQELDLTATGSGRSYARVSSRLDAKLTGSGSLYYKGTPRVTVRTTGSGRVVDAN